MGGICELYIFSNRRSRNQQLPEMKLLLILCCIFFIGSVSAATPPTVYVDTDASGDYDCDGTDDHVQINQALAFVGSNAGYTTVHLNGSNTYWINLTLDMYENTVFQGDSDAEIKLFAGAAWAAYVPMISNTTAGSTNFTIRNFIIDGNSENKVEIGGLGYYNMMLFENCNNITVDNMRLEWSTGDGLKVSANGGYIGVPVYATFTNNSVYKLGHDAFYCMRVNNVTAHDNDIFIRRNSGIRFSDTGNATAYNNTIHAELTALGSTGPGLEIDKNDGVVQKNIEIYNNTFHTMWGSGIFITNEDDDNEIRGYDVHIHHNTFYNVGQYHINNGRCNAAITIGQSNNTIIENNIIDDGGHAGIKYFIKPNYYKIQADFTTIVRNNIIINTDGQTTSPAGHGAGIWNYNDTRHTFISYNNCFYNNTEIYNGTNITHYNDIYVNPLLYNESNHDYYLNSTVGTWNGTDWEVMSANSPCIDAGYSKSDYSDEPIPNGGIINIGRYGGTFYASKSLPVVTFISPTLANDSTTADNYVEVNASINTNNLTDFVWNWNGTNTTILNDSCVLHMSFDNNSAIGESSTVVVDVSQQGSNGSFIDGDTGNWTTQGNYNGAMSFDGSGDFISIIGNPNINDDQLTIIAWVNPSLITGNKRIISHKSSGWYFEIDDTGELEAYLYGTTNPGYHKMSTTIPLNEYTFVAMTYNGTNVTLYKDDEYETWANTGNIVSSSTLVLGGTGTARNYTGMIDEVRDYRCWHSHEEIEQMRLSNLYKYNNTHWYFWSNQTGLSEGEYNYQLYTNDVESDYSVVTYDTTPPASITNLVNNTGEFYHNWTWTNPIDADFNYTTIYINNTWVVNTSDEYYNLTTASAHNQSTISTKTVDTTGNVNATWVNHTSIISIVVTDTNSIDDGDGGSGGGQQSSGWGLEFNISGPISRLDGLVITPDPLRQIYFGLSLLFIGVFMFVDGLSFKIDKSRQKTFTKIKYQVLIAAGLGLGVLGAAVSRLVIFS